MSKETYSAPSAKVFTVELTSSMLLSGSPSGFSIESMEEEEGQWSI